MPTPTFKPDDTYRVVFDKDKANKLAPAHCSTPQVAAGLARFYGQPVAVHVQRYDPRTDTRRTLRTHRLTNVDLTAPSWADAINPPTPTTGD